MVNNIYNMTNEEIIKEFSKEININFNPKYQRSLEEYKQKIKADFDKEWPKKHFKWLFKKRRQRKLRSQIMHRYTCPIFWIIEEVIEDTLSKEYIKFGKGLPPLNTNSTHGLEMRG